MSAWRRVGRRTVVAVLTIYLVVSATFMFVALTPDYQLKYQLSNAERAGASQEELEQIRESYLEKHGKSGTLAERYVGWLVDVTTLDWGRSATQDAPVTTVLVDAGLKTLTYVLPAVLLATLLGILAGLYAAMHPGSLVDRLGSGTAYFGFGLPDYFIAVLLVFLLFQDVVFHLQFGQGLFARLVIPTVALGTTLFAGQFRYSRAESAEYLGAEFVTLLRAKGAGTVTVAWHVLRNAAAPVISLFLTDLLGVLVLNVYVIEATLGIEGFGHVSFVAIRERDVPLVLGTTMVVALVGVVGSFLQDAATVALDPRTAE